MVEKQKYYEEQSSIKTFCVMGFNVAKNHNVVEDKTQKVLNDDVI